LSCTPTVLHPDVLVALLQRLDVVVRLLERLLVAVDARVVVHRPLKLGADLRDLLGAPGAAQPLDQREDAVGRVLGDLHQRRVLDELGRSETGPAARRH
jgi:hypothetical protein